MTQTTSRSGSTSGGGTATAALLIAWGTPVQGREQRAAQVLTEALEYAQQLQQQGQIERYDAIALEPHGREISGLVVLHSDKDRLAQLRTSNELLRLENRTSMVFNHVDVMAGFEGEAFDAIWKDRSQQARDLS